MTTAKAASTSREKSPNAASKTLDKGLRLLRVLADHPDGLNVSQASRLVDVHRTVAYRLLRTLMDHDLVASREDGSYRLGVGLVTLSRSAQPALRDAASRQLVSLAEQCDATAFLVVRKNEEAVVLEAVEPRNTTMHVAYRVGTASPLSRGASGIAILSALPPKKGEREAIGAARSLGYAITSGELSPGAWGLAAPIRVNGHSTEASIGVVTFKPLDETRTARIVLEAAALVARELA